MWPSSADRRSYSELIWPHGSHKQVQPHELLLTAPIAFSTVLSRFFHSQSELTLHHQRSAWQLFCKTALC